MEEQKFLMRSIGSKKDQIGKVNDQTTKITKQYSSVLCYQEKMVTDRSHKSSALRMLDQMSSLRGLKMVRCSG